MYRLRLDLSILPPSRYSLRYRDCVVRGTRVGLFTIARYAESLYYSRLTVRIDTRGNDSGAIASAWEFRYPEAAARGRNPPFSNFPGRACRRSNLSALLCAGLVLVGCFRSVRVE